MLFLALALAIVGGTLGLVCFNLFRQKQGLEAILAEGARGFESLRSRAQYMEKSVFTLESQIKDVRKREEATRSALSEMTSRAFQAEADLDMKSKDFERRFRNVELQRDHMITQHEYSQEALNEANRRSESLKLGSDSLAAENARLIKDVAEAQTKAALKLRQENVELRKKITDLERDLRGLRQRSDVNPRDFDTLKRKVGQYEMLYTGMKSQREMADERNRNWESALERMAEWILTKSPLAEPNDPILSKGIGPKVGEVLSRIGGGLLSIDSAEEETAERAALEAASETGDSREQAGSSSRLS